MRNPDGSLVHPPKQKSMSNDQINQQQKSSPNMSKPFLGSNQLTSQDVQHQDSRNMQSPNSLSVDSSSTKQAMNIQVPVKNKKMNIKSINSDQVSKSTNSFQSNKAKKVQKVRPPGSIGLQPTSSIKLTSASQGKSPTTQVLSFSASQGLTSPTKGVSITDADGMQHQVQLKTVDTSPNSMIKDLSHVRTAEERLKMLQDAVSDAMKTSIGRTAQLHLPKSTTATKVKIDKQSSLQQQSTSSNSQQSKPKSSSTSIPSSAFASSNRSSSPHVSSGEIKLGNDVTMTKASTAKSSTSSAYISNSAKQSLEAVAEFAAAMGPQAAQSHPFDLAQYIEMFTKTSSPSINSAQSAKAVTSTSYSGKNASSSSSPAGAANSAIPEGKPKSSMSPSPNSKLIQSANKAVNKTKQSLKVPDNGSNQVKRSTSSGDISSSSRTTNSNMINSSSSTTATSSRPKSTNVASNPGSESRPKNVQSKNSNMQSSKLPSLDSSHFNDIYSQMQLALQRGDEKAYTQLISQLQASMIATSSSQSPSTSSPKASSNSNSPTANSVILKSEKAKGSNVMQPGAAVKKPTNSTNKPVLSKPTVSKSSEPKPSSNESTPSAIVSRSNQSIPGLVTNTSTESLNKQSAANVIVKAMAPTNKNNASKYQKSALAASSISPSHRGIDHVPQTINNAASSKQGLLTTCTQPQKQIFSNDNITTVAGASVLKSHQTQQIPPQRTQNQPQNQHANLKQQPTAQPQKKIQQQKTVQIMSVSSSVNKEPKSTQQNSVPSNYYQISPTAVQGHNITSDKQIKSANSMNINTIVGQQASNYAPKTSSMQPAKVSASPKLTTQNATSLSYMNQGNILVSSSNPATIQQANVIVAQPSSAAQSRQIPVLSSSAATYSVSNTTENLSSTVATPSPVELLSSPMQIQQTPKRLSAADTTQMLSSLKPCQPPAKPLQIGVSSYSSAVLSTTNTPNSSPSSQKISRSPQIPSSNVSVTLPFSNQVSVASQQFQANVIHVNQAPTKQTNQNQSTFSTAKALPRISVTQAPIQRSQAGIAQSQTQLQPQISSPATLTPVITSPIQGYAKVSPSSSYQHVPQISPNTRQVQQIISPSHGMSVTPIHQQKAPTLGLTIQQAGSSTMTNVTPNANMNVSRKLTPSSLASSPAISITGVSAASPLNVSLESVNGGNGTTLYNSSSLQGGTTLTLPSTPMSFNNKNNIYHQQTHAQQQVTHQQSTSINTSAKSQIMHNNSSSNMIMGGGNTVRQIQMQTVAQQQPQQVHNNMTAMYSSGTVAQQQFAAYGGQQQQTISPQHGNSQQQGATLITVSPSHHQTVQISSPQFQGLQQNTPAHINIPMQQTSQGATTVTLQQQQHSSRGDLDTPPPFNFTYTQ